jgi:hypothetical protein
VRTRPETFTSILLALAAVSASADPAIPPVVYPVIAASGARTEDFVPSGWKVELQKSGDLNGDRLPDVLMVLRMDDPKNIVHGDAPSESQSLNTNPRMLVMMFATDSGAYRLALADHRFIPRNDDIDSEDYFGGAAIAGKNIQIGLVQAMTAGSWSLVNYQYTFHYQQGCFRLIGTDTVEVNRADGTLTKVSDNLLTQRSVKRTGTISSDRDSSVVWSRLPVQPLTCLQDTRSDLAETGPAR